MSTRMPVVFVSHGAPDALLKAPDTVACWRELGKTIPEPKAILVISAHWEARVPTVSMSGAPETIHDFGGFAEELFRMQYPAPGAPALAERVVTLLADSGIKSALHPSRGLDHGAWVPLSAMFPQANIPVTQLSLIHHAGPNAHINIGKALATLRDEGVLIIASGAITHNFNWLSWRAAAGQITASQAQRFAEWLAAALHTHDVTALEHYREVPYGADAHPTEEHFMPLFVAVGAAMDDDIQRIPSPFTYGALAMDAYIWRETPNAM